MGMLRMTVAHNHCKHQAPAYTPFQGQKPCWATILKRSLMPGHQWGMAHPAVCDQSKVTFLMLKFSSVTLRWISLSDYTRGNPKLSHSFPRKNNNKNQVCSKTLASHSLHLHVIVADPLLSGHTIYPSKGGIVPRGLRCNQCFGGIFLFRLIEQGLWDPSWTAAAALNTQEVWDLGLSIGLNDDSGDGVGHRPWGSSEGHFPKILTLHMPE